MDEQPTVRVRGADLAILEVNAHPFEAARVDDREAVADLARREYLAAERSDRAARFDAPTMRAVEPRHLRRVEGVVRVRGYFEIGAPPVTGREARAVAESRARGQLIALIHAHRVAVVPQRGER